MSLPFAFKWGCALCVGLFIQATSVAASDIEYTTPLDSRVMTAHIAAILPLNSATFAAAAQSVQNGLLSASAIPNDSARNLPIKFYPTGDGDDIQKVYLQASQAGAVMVIGGLNKADASLIALSPNAVPTLVLNTVYRTSTPPNSNLYSFSLSAEDEATQLANLAYNSGCRKAVSVSADTPLAQRVQTSFLNAWQLLGGTMLWARTVKQDKTELNDLRKSLIRPNNSKIDYPECILLAADAQAGRSLRPFMGKQLPIYATAMIDDGKRDGLSLGDLQGITYVDMPWLITPDDPAWTAYPRPQQSRTDLQRLYAFGVDAYRLSMEIAHQNLTLNTPMQGLTGTLSLLDNNTILRELPSQQMPKAEGLLGPAQ